MITPLQKFAPDYHFDINQLKRFGCIAYMKVQQKIGPKFRTIGKRVVLVGYTPTGYQFLKPDEGKYYKSRDVRFNEKLVYGDKYGKTGINNWPSTNSKIDDETWFTTFKDDEDENNVEFSKTEGAIKRKRGRPRKVKQNETNEVDRTNQEPRQTDKRLDDYDLTEDRFNDNSIVDRSLNDVVDEENEQIRSNFVVKEMDENEDVDDEIYYALLAKVNDDPKNIKEAMKAPERDSLEKAINDELNSMEQNKVWKLVDRSTLKHDGKKANIIDSKWVLKRKIDKNNDVKFKARLVIRGFKDTNEYDLRETYAPVSRLPVVRAVLAIINKYDLNACQLDVKTAFLNGTIEDEIYMEIPEGTNYSEKTKNSKVCKLEKALYGLRISPKRWNEKFSEVAIKIGLTNEDNEPCLYTWRMGKSLLILLLYVDDILMASNDCEKMNDVKIKLQNEFEMTDLGESKEYLGLTIDRNKGTRCIKLTQEKYIENILEKYLCNKKNPERTPMIVTQVVTRERKEREADDDDELEEEITEKSMPYREAVGSLLYLAGATRPDITYAVNILARHQVNPTSSDWKMVTRVLAYLKGTKKFGLTYLARHDGIQGYSDASFADCKDSRTTCGFVIQLYGDPITWRTRKQSYIALSTCQAEYVALSEACQEMISIERSIKLIINENYYPMKLWCDNLAAESCAKTSGGNKLRHMTEIREHYVKECVKRNLIEIKWIPSRNRIAEIFTKPLPYELHTRLTNCLLNRNLAKE